MVRKFINWKDRKCDEVYVDDKNTKAEANVKTFGLNTMERLVDVAAVAGVALLTKEIIVGIVKATKK